MAIIQFAPRFIFLHETLNKASDIWLKRPQHKKLDLNWTLAHNFKFSILKSTALSQATFQHILYFKHNFSICSLTSENNEQPSTWLMPKPMQSFQRSFLLPRLLKETHVATIVSPCTKCTYQFPCAPENVVVPAFPGETHWHNGNASCSRLTVSRTLEDLCSVLSFA